MKKTDANAIYMYVWRAPSRATSDPHVMCKRKSISSIHLVMFGEFGLGSGINGRGRAIHSNQADQPFVAFHQVQPLQPSSIRVEALNERQEGVTSKSDVISNFQGSK